MLKCQNSFSNLFLSNNKKKRINSSVCDAVGRTLKVRRSVLPLFSRSGNQIKNTNICMCMHSLQKNIIVSASLSLFFGVSRTQQDWQIEPCVKALLSPFSAEFLRHCVLNGGTQRRAFLRNQSEDIKNKSLNPFLQNFCGRKSMKFGTLIG